MFWDLVHYGWLAFMALAVVSVFGAAFWDATAPKRRLAKAARMQKKSAEPVAEAEPAAADEAVSVAEAAPVAEAALDEAEPPVAQ
jgi:hypothetical protein